MDRLIFIYDADSGAIALIKDALKKWTGVLDCALCDITHGKLGEKAAWRTCAAALGMSVTYLHRDQLPTEWPRELTRELPVILSEREGQLSVLVDKAALVACHGDVEAARRAIATALGGARGPVR